MEPGARALLDIQMIVGDQIAKAYIELRKRPANADAILGFTHDNEADVLGFLGDKAEAVLTLNWGGPVHQMRARRFAMSMSYTIKGTCVIRYTQ